MFEGFPIVCKSMETNDPRGVAKHDWHNFCKRPLAIATYQISKLWALWFQRIFF